MELIIFKIIFSILIIRIVFLQIMHGFAVFYDKATKDVVNIIMKDPAKYVKDEHMCKIMDNFIWLTIFVLLLISAFNGNVTIN